MGHLVLSQKFPQPLLGVRGCQAFFISSSASWPLSATISIVGPQLPELIRNFLFLTIRFDSVLQSQLVTGHPGRKSQSASCLFDTALILDSEGK